MSAARMTLRPSPCHSRRYAVWPCAITHSLYSIPLLYILAFVTFILVSFLPRFTTRPWFPGLRTYGSFAVYYAARSAPTPFLRTPRYCYARFCYARSHQHTRLPRFAAAVTRTFLPTVACRTPPPLLRTRGYTWFVLPLYTVRGSPRYAARFTIHTVGLWLRYTVCGLHFPAVAYLLPFSWLVTPLLVLLLWVLLPLLPRTTRVPYAGATACLRTAHACPRLTFPFHGLLFMRKFYLLYTTYATRVTHTAVNIFLFTATPHQFTGCWIHRGSLRADTAQARAAPRCLVLPVHAFHPLHSLPPATHARSRLRTYLVLLRILTLPYCRLRHAPRLRTHAPHTAVTRLHVCSTRTPPPPRLPHHTTPVTADPVWLHIHRHAHHAYRWITRLHYAGWFTAARRLVHHDLCVPAVTFAGWLPTAWITILVCTWLFITF